jgi:hypothetical protein
MNILCPQRFLTVAEMNFREAFVARNVRIQPEHNARKVHVGSNQSKTCVFVAAAFVRMATLINFKLDIKFEKPQQQVGSLQAAPAWHRAVPHDQIGSRHQVAKAALKLGQDVLLLPDLEFGPFWAERHKAAPAQVQAVVAFVPCIWRKIIEQMNLSLLTSIATPMFDTKVSFALC